jgi:hypothetical protein
MIKCVALTVAVDMLLRYCEPCRIFMTVCF